MTEYADRGRPALPVSNAISRYLAKVIEKNERLEFGSPHYFKFDRRLELDKVWIPPEVTVQDFGAALTGAPPDEKKQVLARGPLPVDVIHRMTIFRKAVVLGLPGHGKSTLCQRLTYLLATGARSGTHGWIPVRLDAEALLEPWTRFEDLFGRLDPAGHDTQICEELAEAAAQGRLWFFVDGLDEIDRGRMADVRSRLTSNIVSSRNPVTLTCRSADYAADPLRRFSGLPILVLAPFNEERLDEYVQIWHRQARLDQDEAWAEERASKTRALIDAHDGLRDLASSPFLAALLCVVGSHRRREITSRADLLRNATDHLLRREARNPQRGAGHGAPLDPDVLLEVVSRLAYDIQCRDPGTSPRSPDRSPDGAGYDDLKALVAAELGMNGAALTGPDSDDTEAEVSAYLDCLVGRTSAGLLQERSPGNYGFAHRLFREYLAARHIMAHASFGERLEHVRDPSWREVFLLSASICRRGDHALTDLLVLVHALLTDRAPARLPTPPVADAVGRGEAACLAAEMLVELGEAAAVRYGHAAAVTGPPSTDPGDPDFTGLWNLAAGRVLAIASDTALPRALRFRAMCVVSALRDPRFVDEQGALRSEVLGETVPIPGGTGTVGTRVPLPMRERKQVPSGPQTRVQVRQFEIGRRPVTNLEYRAFVDDGGYEDGRWWTGPEAARWRANDKDFVENLIELWEQQKELNFSKEFSEPQFAAHALNSSERIARRTMSRNKPLYWDDSRFKLPTAPVVGVNLWEAQAYCRWLRHRWTEDGRIGPHDVVDLPTEIEWEWAAARGWTDKPRSHPWGDAEPSLDRCLIRDFTGPGEPRVDHFGAIPVGFFTLGARSDGPEDLGGNVWEWVSSLQLPWNDPADRERAGGLEKRGVRGGSWYSLEEKATHVSFRLDDPPCNAYWDLGFRYVVRFADAV